jgi:isoleucyl-tRNA synthetase
VLSPLGAEGRTPASLQAEVTVHADDASLRAFDDETRFLFITSGVAFAPADARPADAAAVEGQPAWVTARATTHAKCIRCWHHRADVGSHADDPELCGRCVDNVAGAGETRRYF